jgi:hypothetical protein
MSQFREHLLRRLRYLVQKPSPLTKNQERELEELKIDLDSDICDWEDEEEDEQ